MNDSNRLKGYFGWHLFWDEFEEIYHREEAEKYWGQTVYEDQDPF
jgi:hypothetical protein